jgi:hypothetical protein
MPTQLDIVNTLVAEPTSNESRSIDARVDKVPHTEGAGSRLPYSSGAFARVRFDQ